MVARLLFPAFVAGITALALAGASGATTGRQALAYYAGSLALVYAAVAAAERLRPHRVAWRRPHGDVATDATHLVLTGTIASQLGLGLVAALVWLLGGRPTGLWPSGWPMAAQLALAILLAEFGHYWFHRLTHERPFLWRFHAVHHSAPRLYWLNATRFHPLDLAGLVASQTLPLVLFGVAPAASFAYAIFAGSYGQLQHGNIDLDSGPLRWIFSSPELHRWHHSIDPREGNTNYGAILSVWDWMFGSWFWPTDRTFTGPLGVAGRPDFPQTYAGQLLAPFR